MLGRCYTFRLIWRYPGTLLNSFACRVFRGWSSSLDGAATRRSVRIVVLIQRRRSQFSNASLQSSQGRLLQAISRSGWENPRYHTTHNKQGKETHEENQTRLRFLIKCALDVCFLSLRASAAVPAPHPFWNAMGSVALCQPGGGSEFLYHSLGSMSFSYSPSNLCRNAGTSATC